MTLDRPNGGGTAWRTAATAFALAVALYHLAANYYGLMQPLFHTSIHLGSMVALAFFLTPSKAFAGLRRPWLNLALAAVVGASLWYTSVAFIDIQERGIFPNRLDMLAAVVAIAGILEATRRYYGWPLPLIALTLIAYGVFGDRVPAAWQHTAWDLEYLTYTLYMGGDGIFGVAAKTSATLIVTFVMLGAFLEKVGATERIVAMATNLTAPYAGGPAKVAIVASGMMGTVSGSSVANVVATGRFTIPLMVGRGYRPAFAAGVEAVASTGGLLMPPIMGAGAFVMAEILGISYWTIAAAAIGPALLYYLVILTAVHFEARRRNEAGGRREQPMGPMFLKGLPFLLPVAVLLGFIAVDVSPLRAALYTMLFIVALATVLVRPLSPKLLLAALADGAREAVPIACACACAGIIIGTLGGTGFAIKFSGMLMDLSGGHTLLSLVLAMLVVIFLGMALPATASYLIGAAVVAAPLIQMGYPPLAVHLFIFYFSNLSHITPPVDLATYAAASIARANPLSASFDALRLGLIAFILPFVFLTEPVLLLIDFQWAAFLKVLLTAVAGSVVLAGGLMGWFGAVLAWPVRAVLLVAGLLLLQGDFTWSLVGAAAAALAVLYLRIGARAPRETLQTRCERGTT